MAAAGGDDRKVPAVGDEGKATVPKVNLRGNLACNGEDDDDELPLAYSKAARKRLENASADKDRGKSKQGNVSSVKKGGGLADENKSDKAKRPTATKAKKAAVDDSEDDNDDYKLASRKGVTQSTAKQHIKVKKEVAAYSSGCEDGKGKKSNIIKRDEKAGTTNKRKRGLPDKGKAKREKKVYSLTGQKHDPPEERDPLRIFYETLRQQVPSSEMAAIWLMEWGLLPEAEARKVFENKGKRSQQLRSPAKPASLTANRKPLNKTPPISGKDKAVALKKGPANKEVASKKRTRSDSEDDDDDFQPVKSLGKRLKALK